MSHKYYKQTFVFEVLGNEPMDEGATLLDLHNATYTGHHSGDMKSVVTVEVTKEEMHKLLEDQRSDADFLDDPSEEEDE
jgi:hypothetical protein